MSTGVNFMSLHIKIEIWKRLEMFSKLQNRLDAQSASKHKIAFRSVHANQYFQEIGIIEKGKVEISSRRVEEARFQERSF